MFNIKITSVIDHEQRCLTTSYLVNLKWESFQEQYLYALNKTLRRLKLNSEVLAREVLFKDPNTALNQLINYQIVHPNHSDINWLIKTLKDYISSKKNYGNEAYRVFTPAAGEFHQYNGARGKTKGQE